MQTGSASSKLSPSKITVMLQILDGDSAAGINITGYAIQYGYFLCDNDLTAYQYGNLWKYNIYIKMKANGNPVVHATTTTGKWTPSMTTVTFTEYGLTHTPGALHVRSYKIPFG